MHYLSVGGTVGHLADCPWTEGRPPCLPPRFPAVAAAGRLLTEGRSHRLPPRFPAVAAAGRLLTEGRSHRLPPRFPAVAAAGRLLQPSAAAASSAAGTAAG